MIALRMCKVRQREGRARGATSISRKLRRVVCLNAILAAGLSAYVARADESWPYARVTCDSPRGEVTIRQDYSESRSEIPKEKGVVDLYSLTAVRTVNVEASGVQDFLVPVKSFRHACTLKKSRVAVRIDPWKFQPRISGMCGAGSPNVKLNAWSDHVHIAKDLKFSGLCTSPGADIVVHAVTIRPRDRVAVIEYIDNSEASDRVYTKTVSFEELSTFDRETLLRK